MDDYVMVDDLYSKNEIIIQLDEDYTDFSVQMIMFDAVKYIDSIKKTYNNTNENVYVQWAKDFHRQIIKINGKCVSDVKFIEFATKFNSTILLFMLATQASFFLPFSTINNIYTSSNIIVVDAGKNKICDSQQDVKNIIIKFILIVNLFDFDKEKVIEQIETEMIINLNNCKINKYGILTWKKLKL
jgi:hypothetical protein